MNVGVDYNALRATLNPLIQSKHKYSVLVVVGSVSSYLSPLFIIASESEKVLFSNREVYKLAGKVVVYAIVLFVTAFGFIQYGLNQREIDKSFSQAIGQGEFTPAKKEFLKTYGKHCNKLYGENPYYVEHRDELKKYMYATRFYNVSTKCWEYIHPDYRPSRY